MVKKGKRKWEKETFNPTDEKFDWDPDENFAFLRKHGEKIEI